MHSRHNFAILCVDDETSVLKLLGTLFDAAGYQVQMAINAFVALQKLNKNPHAFQLIITDIRMPGMDGFAFIQQARTSGYTGRVIVYAGMMSPDDLQHLRELGVERAIAKPSTSKLISTVRELQATA